MTPLAMPDGREQGLTCQLTSPLPNPLVIGKGMAVPLEGWLYHPTLLIDNVVMTVDGRAHRVKAFRLPRPDVFEQQFPELDPRGHSKYSGFCAVIPLPAREAHSTIEVGLRVRLQGGERCTVQLATVDVQADVSGAAPLPPYSLSPLPSDSRVAICMTTYNPPLELFRRQVDSIRAQTYDGWTCVISDDCSNSDVAGEMLEILGGDPRFALSPAPASLGFYRNFERCLSLVPGDCDLVALSDHDDYWHQDKLSVLVGSFGRSTSLVYSDMNIVDQAGRRLSDTYWTTRPNNYTDFTSLLLANTITGAASAFRSELLPFLLPFPPKLGPGYHDHWIACACFALGDIAYVDRALYDYVQHDDNVLGHFAPPRLMRARKTMSLAHELAQKGFRQKVRKSSRYWQALYLYEVLRIETIARTLDLRCADAMAAEKAKSVARLARADGSMKVLVWLALRGLRNFPRPSATLGAEYGVAKGVLWRRLASFKGLARYALGSR